MMTHSAVTYFEDTDLITAVQSLYELINIITNDCPWDPDLPDHVLERERYIRGIEQRVDDIEKARKFYNEWGCEEYPVNFTPDQVRTILEAIPLRIAQKESENAKRYIQMIFEKFQEYLRLLEEEGGTPG